MSPLNKLFIFFASAYMSEAFPTDFDSKVTPFIDKVIYTCSQLPFRLVCPQTQFPSQSVTRWYVKDGKCCSYKYGYCQWEEIRTETAIRTKEACEAICLRAEAPTAPPGSYQTAGFVPAFTGFSSGSTGFSSGFPGVNSPSATFSTGVRQSTPPIGFNPTVNPYAVPDGLSFPGTNTPSRQYPTGFDGSFTPTQSISTFSGNGINQTPGSSAFPSSSFGTPNFPPNSLLPTNFPPSSLLPSNFPSNSFTSSTSGFNRNTSPTSGQPNNYAAQTFPTGSTGLITNSPSQYRPTGFSDPTGRFGPIDNGYQVPNQKPLVPFV